MCVAATVLTGAALLLSCVCCAVSKALEQIDAAVREAAAARQRCEQLEQEVAGGKLLLQQAHTDNERCVDGQANLYNVRKRKAACMRPRLPLLPPSMLGNSICCIAACRPVCLKISLGPADTMMNVRC